MILVDTSLWIDHINAPVAELQDLLNANEALIHSMVIGEIACGTIRNRAEVVHYLRSLPRIAEVSHERVLQEIEAGGFMWRGIGFIDAHLLSSVIADDSASLWTRDRRLERIAGDLGVAFSESLG